MINCDIFNNPPVAKEALEIWARESREAYDVPYASLDTRKIHEALAAIYEAVGAKSEDHFFFFSSEEEAMENVFSHVLFDHMFETGKHHILSLETEGAATLSLLRRFERAGCSYQLIDGKDLAAAMSPRVGFVTMTWAHPLTGAIQPIQEIAELCKKHKVPLHVRGTEALGRLFFRYQDLPIDFFTFSGSSFYLPQGGAGLFVKKGSKMVEFMAPIAKAMGNSIVPTNIPALIAMGEMANLMVDQMETGALETARLRGEFEEELKMRIPEVLCLNEGIRRLINVSVIAFPYVVGEALLFELAEKKICASIGGGRVQTLEYVLEKMGVHPFMARSAVSFAFSPQMTEGEIKQLVGLLAMLVEKYGALTRGLR